MENKLTIQEFIDQVNYQMSGTEPQEDDVVTEIKEIYKAMFLENCGEVPEFEVDSFGKIKLCG